MRLIKLLALLCLIYIPLNSYAGAGGSTSAATVSTPQPSCTKTMTYYMTNTNTNLQANPTYQYSAASSGLPLCPGNYTVTVHLKVWANTGGGSNGCGAYRCGLLSAPFYDTAGNQLLPAIDLGDRDYNFEYKVANLSSSSGNYTSGDGTSTSWTPTYFNPANGNTIGPFALVSGGDRFFMVDPSSSSVVPTDWNWITLTWHGA